MLGAATVFVSPWLTLAAVIALVLLVIILNMPELGILGILGFTSTLLSSDANMGISIGIGHIYLTDILLLTLLSLIVLRALAERNFQLVRTPLDIPLLAFVGIAFFSTFVAIQSSSLTIQDSLGEMRSIANYLIFFAVTNLIRKDRQVKTLLIGLFVLASLVAIAMIIQYILGPSTQLIPGRVEVLSTEGTSSADVTRIIPPGYSLVFVAFLFLSVIHAYQDFKLHRLWLLLPWLLTGLAVLLTFKRHFWVSVIAVFLLLLWFSKRDEVKRMAAWGFSIAVISLLGIALLVFAFGEPAVDLLNSSVVRLASLTRSETYQDPNSSLRWRDFEYQYAYPQILSHPLLGLGLGAQYRPLVPHRDHEGFDGRGFIHNAHVWIMVKTGLLGYVAMLCLIAIFLYRGFRYWNTLSTQPARATVLGCTLVFLGMFIGTIVEPMLIEWRWTALLALIMGINETVLRLYGSHEKLPARG
jgi:O-antigen ligase